MWGRQDYVCKFTQDRFQYANIGIHTQLSISKRGIVNGKNQKKKKNKERTQNNYYMVYGMVSMIKVQIQQNKCETLDPYIHH